MTAGLAMPDTDQDRRDAAFALEVRGLTKRYGRRAAPALDDVSAAVPRGVLTAVMGLSGSGKSTLLQCAAGLDQPSSGTVLLGGVELTALKRRPLSVLRRRRVGFVFQSLNLVPTLTVAENIALPLRLDHRRVDKPQLEALAERVGVAELAKRLPHTLSGGQQQRVAIARALVNDPDVVFADEPTAALDPHTSAQIRALLRWAVSELGRTVVVVTHEPTLAADADRVLLLHGGRVVGDLVGAGEAELVARVRELGGDPR